MIGAGGAAERSSTRVARAVLSVPDTAQREDLAGFVGRAVRLDPAVVVRLRARPGERDAVEAFAPTPFDALVTRSAPGTPTLAQM